VTYVSGSASFVARTDETTVSKPLPVVRTRKRIVRSSSCEMPRYEACNASETRAEIMGREAFEEMFAASRPKFITIACTILRNTQDAEDAVQNAFLSGYLHLRGFEGRSALKTWFTRIVMNAALMIQRKRKLFTTRTLSKNHNSHDFKWTENIPASEPNPEMVHAERETLQLIDGILGKMKPVLRQAFTMTYFDELSGPEACAAIGISLGTFKARLSRAKRVVFGQTKRALWLSCKSYELGAAARNEPRSRMFRCQ
jgi:RNA polymerase sigma-70 factor (ECF subfamily)